MQGLSGFRLLLSFPLTLSLKVPGIYKLPPDFIDIGFTFNGIKGSLDREQVVKIRLRLLKLLRNRLLRPL